LLPNNEPLEAYKYSKIQTLQMKYNLVDQQHRVPRDSAYGTYPKTHHFGGRGGVTPSFVTFYLHTIVMGLKKNNFRGVRDHFQLLYFVFNSLIVDYRRAGVQIPL
jgi:hypothetical protein